MGYLANQPGTEITLDEEIALSQLAALGDPLDHLRVNVMGTGLEYAPESAGATGPTGYTGPAGINGVTGYTGYTGPAGFTPTSGVITKVGGYISSIALGSGVTKTITRDVNNYITSITDGTRTWTYTRDGNNYITSWVVA